MAWKARLAVLSAALWWGSLSAIGFLAVPLLFAATWVALFCWVVARAWW